MAQLQEVFVKQGVPTVTFVKPAEYTKLLVSLKTPGRGIVIEGPSGIGKTTATLKAVEEAGVGQNVINLSARTKSDLALIADLPNMRPFGMVIIGDFHRLGADTKQIVADLMKVLAAESDEHSKIVILGIPNVGEALLTCGRDLSNRI